MTEDLPQVPIADAGSAVTGVPSVPSSHNVRRNKRSEMTINAILDATEQMMLVSGAERISIIAVCKAAHVARGTFYRYFSSQDDLLEAFSTHRRDQFHRAMVEATMQFADPDQRFDALVAYLDGYLDDSRVRRLLIIAPNYTLAWFQRIFLDSLQRFQDVLGVVFDAWEIRFGITLDRELICELLLRYLLSEVLVPGGIQRGEIPKRIGRIISVLLAGGGQRH